MLHKINRVIFLKHDRAKRREGGFRSLTGDECVPIKLCKNIFIKDILKQDEDLDTKKTIIFQ